MTDSCAETTDTLVVLLLVCNCKFCALMLQKLYQLTHLEVVSYTADE